MSNLKKQAVELFNNKKYEKSLSIFLPILKTNNKVSYSPTLRHDRYYVSINDETTKIINDGVPSFKFLQTNDFDIRKIIVETGLELPRTREGDLIGDVEIQQPTVKPETAKLSLKHISEQTRKEARSYEV